MRKEPGFQNESERPSLNHDSSTYFICDASHLTSLSQQSLHEDNDGITFTGLL